MGPMPDFRQFDPKRVSAFHDAFMKPTGHLPSHAEKHIQELDTRIVSAGLTLADKIEVFKRLAPKADVTSGREELRMERIILSVPPQDLPLFKFALEYDGDYKDVTEYVFHDIDNEDSQARIIQHFRSAPQRVGVKVLSDVDDTMVASLIDMRYKTDELHKKMKPLYPGILEFYDALKREPFELHKAIPVTTLTARPSPIAGIMEEHSLEGLVERAREQRKGDQELCPSSLSGEFVSSIIGTVETFVRAKLDHVLSEIPHGQEDQVGIVKFKNFGYFSIIYPEYRYVFVGDSGQADALTAQLMLNGELAEGSARVITTFIHNLKRFEDDGKSASPAFQGLSEHLKIDQASPTGRGVIVFRNYIQAAVIARTHWRTLDDLVTAEGLATVTLAALKQFGAIPFQEDGKASSREILREQYRQDAEAAYQLLIATASRSPALEKDLEDIRRTLDKGF